MSRKRSDLEIATALVERYKHLTKQQLAEALGLENRKAIYDYLAGGGMSVRVRARAEELLAAPEDRSPAYADGYAAALADMRAAIERLAESPREPEDKGVLDSVVQPKSPGDGRRDQRGSA